MILIDLYRILVTKHLSRQDVLASIFLFFSSQTAVITLKIFHKTQTQGKFLMTDHLESHAFSITSLQYVFAHFFPKKTSCKFGIKFVTKSN